MISIDVEEVAIKFDSYPSAIRAKLLVLRELIFQVAAAQNDIGEIEETLKWGEPSYMAKAGSTIRIDWKASSPEKYAIYFNCGTKLVDTFKELHGDKFRYQGNRAIVFEVSEELETDELKQCIALALTYHRVKHLPLLGA